MNEGPPIEGYAEPVKRGPGRPPMARPVTTPAREVPDNSAALKSIAEAEAYAAQIIENLGDTIDQTDIFFIDHDIIPEGWSYAWRRVSVAGKEDPHYQTNLARTGWRAVEAERHPELMPKNWKGPIVKDGLMLMELPKILTDRANAKHIKESKDMLRNSDKRIHETPANTAPRDEFPDRLKKVRREFVRAERPVADAE